MTDQSPARATMQDAIERRAIEAAVWGMPIVSVDAMREAFFRDAGAKYGDIVFWSQPSDWQFPVHHAECVDVLRRNSISTCRTAPSSSRFRRRWTPGCSARSSTPGRCQWPMSARRARTREGRQIFAATAGRYAGGPARLHLHPVPDGQRLCPAARISKTSAAADVAKAIALVKQMRVYPLAAAAAPPEQRYIDMAGQLMDGVVKFDDPSTSGSRVW